MAAGIEQYQELIEQLKPVVGEPDFNQILSQVASNLPKPKRFLLKMELKRQAKPCLRPIDLRGTVDGQCQPYEFEGITHHLDDVAIEVFERQVRSFGHYTLGVYEAVTNTENNFRVMHQKALEQGTDIDTISGLHSSAEESPERRYLTPTIKLGSVLQRNEERMNFVAPLELFTELKESVHATSIDISVGGLKVKAPKRHLFKPGEKVSVHFRGLEQDYGLKRGEVVHYVIADIDRSRDEQRISLKRLFEQGQQNLDSFLERFIQGNKRRYKVNMENTIEAIRIKGYEQYYVPQITSLPVFIEAQGDKLHPKFVMTNDCNPRTLHFWHDEEGEQRLGYLLSQERLARWSKQLPHLTETYLFVFTHSSQDHTYFYSASLEELAEQRKLHSTYLAYGSRKASWRVYKMQMTPMHPDQCHDPLSLPDNVGEHIKRLNQPPSARLLSNLKALKYIVLLTDITNHWNTQTYQKHKLVKQQLTALHVFCHPRNRPPEMIMPYRFRYQELRHETRYTLRTPVLLYQGGSELEAITEDISPSGLRLELKHPFPSSEGGRLEVSLPKLQALGRKYQLQSLPYRVMRVSPDKTVLHLMLLDERLEKQTREFFEALIKQNRASLKPTGSREDLTGIGEALRNIYTANLLNIGLFIRKNGIELVPENISVPPSDHPLLPLISHLNQPDHFNLYALYSAHAEGRSLMEKTLKSLRTHDKPVSLEIWVAFNPRQQEIRKAIQVRLPEQFENEAQRRDFIGTAMGGGKFIAMRVFISRTGRPDTSFLHAELNYVGVYAVHKAKSMEEELWAVYAMADLLDITNEVMFRYAFNTHQIQSNASQFQLT
ncbi:PilZ domain-containing protein [Aliiglaciecola sp. CAU 1673]|uniref:PilZ domain-containing protein n=1 Tax=Aliiglaciecola sp. CAU 1673 TaxID=3032595 RepID=UPI0023DC86FD|nr:PilZ domain-containing protein [Aliiglaciecola sp. CAU 1673]MDF2178008.1 PilZ domain-containing protein [Aliiglaciecola sp. CAU 1673]